MATLDDIVIRTDLRPGDLGAVVSLHGTLYSREYGYDMGFEAYVAKSLHEFHALYRPERSRLWICEHDGAIIGCLALLDRGEAAQLRYFLIAPGYRGMGLGKRLMELFMDFMREQGYRSSYLLTTDDLGKAAALYTRHGYGLTSEEEADFFGRRLKEQRYDWRET